MSLLASLRRVGLCIRLFAMHYRHSPLQASAILIGIILAVTLLIGVYATNENAKQSYGNTTELLSQQARLSITHHTQTNLDESIYFALVNAGINAIASVEGFAPDQQQRFWRIQGNDTIAALSTGLAQSSKPNEQHSLSMTSTPLPLDQLLAGEPKVLMSSSKVERINKNVNNTIGLTLNNIPVEVLSIDDNVGLGTTTFADISLAQQLLNMQGKLSYIAIFNDDDAISDQQVIDQLSQILITAGINPKDLYFSTQANETESLTALTASFHLNLDAMSMLAFVVGLFIAYNGVRYSLMKRQKLFVQIMQQGVDRRSIVLALSTELLVLVFMGCIIGFVLGLQLSQWLQPMVAMTLEQLYGAKLLPGMWQWQWFAQALLLTLAAGFAACIPMLVNLVRMPLAQGAQKSTQNKQFDLIHKRQFYIAVTLLSGCLFAFTLSNQYHYSLLLLGVLAVAIPLLLPTVLHTGISLLNPIMPKGIWHYAIAETKEIIAPLGLAMMAILLALCANIAMNTLVGSFEITLKKWLDARLHADFYMRPNPTAITDLTVLLTQDPQVSAIYQQWNIPSQLYITSQQDKQAEINLVSRDMQSLKDTSIMKSTITDFWNVFTDGHHVMISEPLAIKHQLNIGDNIEISHLAKYPLTVGAIYYDYGNPLGEAVIPPSLWQQFNLTTLPDSLAVSYLGNVDDLQQKISQQLNIPASFMFSQNKIKIEAIKMFNKTFSITVVLNSLTLLVAAIGLFSACMMLTQARQAPLARLYALGVSRSQLRLMVLIQMLLIVLITCLIALPTGAILGYLLIHKVTLQAFGWSIAMVWDWAAYFQVVMIAVISCLIAVSLPLYWQTRKPLVASLQQEAL